MALVIIKKKHNRINSNVNRIEKRGIKILKVSQSLTSFSIQSWRAYFTPAKPAVPETLKVITNTSNSALKVTENKLLDVKNTLGGRHIVTIDADPALLSEIKNLVKKKKEVVSLSNELVVAKEAVRDYTLVELAAIVTLVSAGLGFTANSLCFIDTLSEGQLTKFGQAEFKKIFLALDSTSKTCLEPELKVPKLDNNTVSIKK